jgi:hypothetical protein
MKERPIIFSAPMVRAILAGTKTQTRRIIDERMFIAFEDPDQRPIYQSDPRFGEAASEWARCPYGTPGDRLWVRETFVPLKDGNVVPIADATYALFRDGAQKYRGEDGFSPGLAEYAPGARDAVRGKWKPSIYLPRWASRITLDVTDVRVERLQEITAEGCIAEGIPSRGIEPPCIASAILYIADFEKAWNAIHGAGSWGANPWVWVIEFRRIVES